MPSTRTHISIDPNNLARLDSLAARYGLTRSATITLLVNRAFLEERIREENTTK